MTKWGEARATVGRKKEHKRRLILRHAAVAFNRSGSHGATLDEVAAQLKISKAALYRYVANKHDLLLACHLEAVEIALRSAKAAERNGGDGWSKIRMTLQRHLEDMMQALGVPAMVFEENALEAESRAKVIALRDEYEALLRSFYDEGVADGSIMEGNAKIAVFALLGALNWTAKWYKPDKSWTAEQIAEAIVETITRGIAARPRERFLSVLHNAGD